MTLTVIDWLIIVGYFLLTIGIGLFFRRRAGSSLSEFFVSGRSLPWWIAGTSMVATTFAADTPLAVTSLIVKNGLAGNWFWWAFAIGGMFTVFVYARLWRRSEVMTDVELIKIRYAGRAADILRYSRAFYIALIVNPIIIGWVIGAMLKVLQQTVFFELEPVAGLSPTGMAWLSIIGMMAVVGVYSTMSGMWGVAVSDVIQFFLAMGGCIWLAVVAVDSVGGIANLETKVEDNFGNRGAFDYFPSLSAQSATQSATVTEALKTTPEATPEENASAAIKGAELFIAEQPELSQPFKDALQKNIKRVRDDLSLKSTEPKTKSEQEESLDESTSQLKSTIKKATPGPWLALHVFLIMLTMQWWATWFPGAEPGGGGYVVQRMAACQDERHSVLATLWYQIAHYCVRPWPWIMISFVALAKYPELRTNYIADDSFDTDIGFPMLMRELCTPGLAGLMLVAFFAAFMSTISTQMNWGASYLVRDFIQPLAMKNASERSLAKMSRIVSIVVLIVGIVFGWFMQGTSVDDAWKLLAALGAGTGLVFMLRWFWWRINAWTEIVAMLASLGYFLFMQTETCKSLIGEFRGEEQMAIIAGATIVTWLLVMFITPAENETTLRDFFTKIKPGGPGWKPIAALEPNVQQDQNLGISIVGALFASGIVYLTLPAIGYFIFGKTALAIGCLVGASACGVIVKLILPRIYNSP